MSSMTSLETAVGSDAPSYPQSSSVGGTPDGTLPSIMLIDDSFTVRKIIEASFARIGLPTTSFPDGFAALQSLAKGEVDVPNLLLLDIGLPRMDGYEVARILRTNKAFDQTIIVMLTGRDGMMDRIRSKMIGARDYVRKPFRVSQVVNVVCAHLHITPPGSPGTASGPGSPPARP